MELLEVWDRILQIFRQCTWILGVSTALLEKWDHRELQERLDPGDNADKTELLELLATTELQDTTESSVLVDHQDHLDPLGLLVDEEWTRCERKVLEDQKEHPETLDLLDQKEKEETAEESERMGLLVQLGFVENQEELGRSENLESLELPDQMDRMLYTVLVRREPLELEAESINRTSSNSICSQLPNKHLKSIFY